MVVHACGRGSRRVNMAKVLAYHPEIHVKKRDGGLVAIRADMPDWASDEEVLSQLARPVGARTVGELVEAMENGGGETIRASALNDVSGCSVEPVGPDVHKEERGWDEAIELV
jgi:hypothetical protein